MTEKMLQEISTKSTILSLTTERNLMDEISNNLENVKKQYDNVNKQIARTLHKRRGLISKLFNKAVDQAFVLAPKKGKSSPLGILEYTLKGAINSSKEALIKIVRKSILEKERIENLYVTLNKAEKEKWNPADFMSFIEQNTDIGFVVTVDNHEIDLKDFQKGLESYQSIEQIKARR